jgi:hypothetical protein
MPNSKTTMTAVVPKEPPPPPPPAAPTANHQDGASSSIAARRRFDANKVVITIVGERQKDLPPLAKQPLTPDWEKRLSAGRKAIEEQARLMQQQQQQQQQQQNLTTTVPVPVPVVPGPKMMIDGRMPPPVRKTNLQRSKIVQTLSIPGVESSSIAGTSSSSAGDHHHVQPKRITALKALQRLKSTLSSPVLVVDPTTTTTTTDGVESIQRRHDLFNGGNPLLLPNGKSGAVKKNLRRRLSGADDDVDHHQTDGSVMSSYQPLEVDLDDDAIMV